MYVSLGFNGRSPLTMLQVYLNIVLDEALEEKAGGEKVRIGMVVIRGNAVVMLEVRINFHLPLRREGEEAGNRKLEWREWQRRVKWRGGRVREIKGEGRRADHLDIEEC